MNIFKEYSDYLKDNPERYWFKRKLYGWGWTPATRQGWWVILGFVVFISAQGVLLEFTPQGSKDVLLFVLNVFFSVIALLLVCKLKGETPKWQWGISKKDKDNPAK